MSRLHLSSCYTTTTKRMPIPGHLIRAAQGDLVAEAGQKPRTQERPEHGAGGPDGIARRAIARDDRDIESRGRGGAVGESSDPRRHTCGGEDWPAQADDDSHLMDGLAQAHADSRPIN